MNSRAKTTIVLAVVAVAVVMSVALLMTFGGSAPAKYATSQVWSQGMSNMQSMKIIDLTGDGQNDLFLQGDRSFEVLDANRNTVQRQSFIEPLTTTLGDVTGDGIEDVIALGWIDGRRGIAVYSQNERLWVTPIENLSSPARVAVVRFPSGPQLIAGDDGGQLVALNQQGKEVWRANLSSGDTIRGLDDALIGGKPYLAAANHDGSVALYDAQGQALWTYSAGTLRRLRAYDLDGDGNGEILLGGDGARLIMLDAVTGLERFNQALGQTITEIREAEINGEPSSREFVVGGKDGGVWAFTAAGEQLWSNNVDDKVTEIAALDVDRDGADETIIGDEGGGLVLFAGKTGERFGLDGYWRTIMRIDTEKFGDGRKVVVADDEQASVYTIEKESAPFFYSPLVVGLLISAAIIVAAWFIASMPQKPAEKIAIEDQSVEGLQAQRRMLHESIADVERMKRSGEMPPEAYAARLKELRSELADNDAALKKAGVKIQVETFKCPNCGGSLPLGVDKCDYCGQVVIA